MGERAASDSLLLPGPLISDEASFRLSQGPHSGPLDLPSPPPQNLKGPKCTKVSGVRIPSPAQAADLSSTSVDGGGQRLLWGSRGMMQVGFPAFRDLDCPLSQEGTGMAARTQR